MSITRKLAALSVASLLTFSSVPAYAQNIVEPATFVPTAIAVQDVPTYRPAVATTNTPVSHNISIPFQRNTDDNVHFGPAGVGLFITGFLVDGEFTLDPTTFVTTWDEECVEIIPTDLTQVRSISFDIELNPQVITSNISEQVYAFHLFIPKTQADAAGNIAVQGIDNLQFAVGDMPIEPGVSNGTVSLTQITPETYGDHLYQVPENIEDYHVYSVAPYGSGPLTLSVSGQVPVNAADWFDAWTASEPTTIQFPIRIIPNLIRCTYPQGNCDQALESMIGTPLSYEEVVERESQSWSPYDQLSDEEKLRYDQFIEDAWIANNAMATLADDIYQPLHDMDSTAPVTPMTFNTDPRGFALLYTEVFGLKQNSVISYLLADDITQMTRQFVINLPVTFLPEGQCSLPDPVTPPSTKVTPPASPAPTPASAPQPALANTGSNAGWLSVVASMLLSSGAIALGLRRKLVRG
ncbi:MAG: hypothetical protein GX483_00250 [Actinomycetaceae bacterium]|nr:hypothetical protein [Actinomycetaceae bacterium]